MGPCSSPETRPPGDDGDYRLCCLDGIREAGTHCLRYDCSAAYQVYRAESFQTITHLDVRIANGEDERTVQVTSPSYQAQIPDFAEIQVTPESSFQSEATDLCFIAHRNDLPEDDYMYLPLAPLPSSVGAYLNVRNWFYMFPTMNALNLSSTVWKNEASCGQHMHRQTATHGEPNHFKLVVLLPSHSLMRMAETSSTPGSATTESLSVA